MQILPSKYTIDWQLRLGVLLSSLLTTLQTMSSPTVPPPLCIYQSDHYQPIISPPLFQAVIIGSSHITYHALKYSSMLPLLRSRCIFKNWFSIMSSWLSLCLDRVGQLSAKGRQKTASLMGSLAQLGRISREGTVRVSTIFTAMPPTISAPMSVKNPLMFLMKLFLKWSGVSSGFEYKKPTRLSGVTSARPCISPGLMSQALGTLPLPCCVCDLSYFCCSFPINQVNQSRQKNHSWLIYTKCIMLLSVARRVRSHLFSLRAAMHTETYQHTEHESEDVKPKEPAYMRLFRDQQLEVIVPESSLLETLRSKKIAQVMASNHSAKQDKHKLEAHIECLYSLVSRTEPSIEAISMFVQQLFEEFRTIANQDINQFEALHVLFAPRCITKLVIIARAIDSFYNESLRMMISTLIIKVLKYEQPPPDLQAAKLPKKLAVCETDFWNGLHYVLAYGYYNTDVLQKAYNKLLAVKQAPTSKDVVLVSLQLKCMVEMDKFKQVSQLPEKIFTEIYAQLMDQYLEMLSDPHRLFPLLQASESIIQKGLVIDFLQVKYKDQDGSGYNQAKQTYLSMLEKILDFAENGSLLMEVDQFKGIFQVLLLMCNHDDTKQVHAILEQLERAMLLYPLQELASLEAHCFLSDFHGYRSDFFAERFEDQLREEWERYQNIKGHLHRLHQANQQLVLARKFLTCSHITEENKDVAATCRKMASELFDSSIWQLIQGEKATNQLFKNFSFESQLYFRKSGIMNFLSRRWPQNKIQQIAKWDQVKNISEDHVKVLQLTKNYIGMHNYKTTHGPGWHDNPHARLSITLQLALNHYDQLKTKHLKDAKTFLNKFLYKAFNLSVPSAQEAQPQPKFQEKDLLLVSKLSYPGVLMAMHRLLDVCQKQRLGWFPELKASRHWAQYRLKQPNIHQENEPEQVKNWHHRPLFQPFLDVIELNQVNIPFNCTVYGPDALPMLQMTDSVLWMVHSNQTLTNYIKSRIRTLAKYDNNSIIESVKTNFVHYPSLGDVLLVPKSEEKKHIIIIIEMDPLLVPNHQFKTLQNEAAAHFKQLSKKVHVVRNQTEVDRLLAELYQNE